MSNFTLTHALAVAEIARRADNRKRKALGQKPAKAAHPGLLKLTGPDLADAAELLAPAPKRTQAAKPAPKAKAPKVNARKGTGVGGPEHTARRKAASEYRLEQFHAGNKITYRDACIAFGTLPAAEMAAQA